MIRRALVLAAGLGSRIRSVAGDLPKPLLPFGDAPVLARTLRWLAASGVEEVWINLHYRPDLVRGAVGDGSAFNLKVHYVEEKELLGTAGALGNIASSVTPSFLVVYGDSLVRCDLAAFHAAHAAAGAEATLALFDQTRHANTGIAGGRVILSPTGQVDAFVEGGDEAGSPLVNAGLYLVEPAVLDLIEPGRLVDFGRDVFPAMLKAGRAPAGHVMEPDGYCLGLDTPQAYAAGLKLLAERRLGFA